jgi:hypothetical protein
METVWDKLWLKSQQVVTATNYWPLMLSYTGRVTGGITKTYWCGDTPRTYLMIAPGHWPHIIISLAAGEGISLPPVPTNGQLLNPLSRRSAIN